MRHKKIMVLALFFVSLLAISVVSASENVTGNVVSVDDTTVVINLQGTVENLNDLENNDLNEDNNQDILEISDSQEGLSLDNSEDVLSEYSPYYNYYSVNVYDTTVNCESSGTITMSINPCTYGDYYKYDYYLRVYDSNNNLKIDQNYYSATSDYSRTYSLSPNQLSPGTYTIEIVNYKDSRLMDTATLTVKSSTGYSYTFPSYTAYSVNVYDTTLTYGSGGTISMSISPASSNYKYKYDYYLRVYDSNNNMKINQEYYSTISEYSKTYTLSSNQLDPGTYAIKIVNYNDNTVMDTARLTVKSSTGYSYTFPSYTAYSVNVYDTTLTYGSGGTISMSINPASSKYKYKYDYFLKIFDSNNNIKINQEHFGTNSDYSRIFTIGSTKLSPGTYTIKIVNYKDSKVMDTAKLTVKSTSNNGASSTTKTTKVLTKISAPKVTAKKGESKKFKITIKNKANNKPVKDVKISVKVGSKNYNLKTNSNGVATLNTKSLSVGTHKVTIKSKNTKYKISAKSTIVIKKATKSSSNYKIITTTAKEYWITKKSGKFTVKTKIWDMTAGFREPYKYIDTTLYKNGKQMINTKYSVNYKIDGVWTGWVKYGTESTAHHRYSVEDSASVDQIKVKVHK